MAHTPNLHLALSDDERQNRNWELLDSALSRLSKGGIIADDLSILGSLDVRDNAHIGGTLSAASVTTGAFSATDAVTSTLHITDNLWVDDGFLVAGGPVILPDRSVAGAALAPGAAVQAAITSTAQTNTIVIGDTAVIANSLTMPASEDGLGRWELCVAQLTFQVALAVGAPNIVTVGVDLLRDGVLLQTRNFHYTSVSAPNDFSFEIPVTMVRLQAITAGGGTVVPGVWAIRLTRTRTPTGVAVSHTFAQLHALQLR